MSEVWLIVIACVAVVVSAAMPLLRDRGTPPPPRKETLRDWRNGD